MGEAVHYRWEDLKRDRPMDKLWRRRVIGDQAMISQVFLEKGCHVPMHAHANEQFACTISGRLRFTLSGGREVIVGAGEVLHLPAHVPHAAEALEDTLVLDIFSPPSTTTGIDRH
jgi:quercetin dioxygenase-like cupin family protein